MIKDFEKYLLCDADILSSLIIGGVKELHHEIALLYPRLSNKSHWEITNYCIGYIAGRGRLDFNNDDYIDALTEYNKRIEDKAIDGNLFGDN